MKNLLFTQTIILNFLRSFFAGVVWLIFALATGTAADATVIFFPLAAPVLLLIFYLLSQVLRIFNLEGIGSIACMFFSVPGDPFVYIIKQIKPDLVPVEKFGIINFASVIYVYDNGVAVEESQSDTAEKCPYKGKVVATKEGSVLGFSWPHEATIFTIGEDWVVKREGRNIGWIDTSGQIREGLKGDIEATLSPGKIISKIQHGQLIINGESYGKLLSF